VELNTSGLFAGVSIYVLDLDYLRNIADDFHDAIDLINLDEVNEFLLEVLPKSDIHLVS